MAGCDKKLLVIGLDGMRPDACRIADTPAIDGVADTGSFTWSGVTEAVTVSGSAWTSCLTGVHLQKHRVVGNEFRWRDRTYRTVFSLAREDFTELRTVARVNWMPIIDDIFEPGSLDIRSGGSDREVASSMSADIRSGSGDLYFIHLDDIDGAGHSFGYGPDVPEYIASIERADRMVAELLGAVESRPVSEEWLVIIVSDHGGREKSHGSPSPEEMEIAFVVSQNDLLPPGPIRTSDGRPFSIVDTAPLVSRYLGLRDRHYWDGMLPCSGRHHGR